MMLPMMADWLNNALTFIFIDLIDSVAYGILSIAYNIFYAVAQLDIFGGGQAGVQLYDGITQRLYMVLSVVMVFVFAYHLIMMIIDPEGKGKGATSTLVKDTMFSIILLIVLPLVYRYMAVFQYHVLENNTIPAIILGTNPTDSDHDPGKNVAMMVLISFFHPNGTTYTTFFDESGNVRGDAVDRCLGDTAAEDGEEHTKTCEKYTQALINWKANNGWVTALTSKEKKLRHWVGDTMTYQFVISTIAAIAVAWCFFIYSIDIGVRAVKLGVLQLISPVPVILRIFPSTRKSFETWLNHLKKTYLELFIRIAVIFFALEIVKLVPVFISIIFQASGQSTAGTFTKCLATAILIFGILRFGQDAPSLFKEIFSTGGNLFGGIKLTPLNPKSRITENKAAMWAAGKGLAAFGGMKSQFDRQYRANKAAMMDITGDAHTLRNIFSSAPSALRGVVTGLRQKDTALKDIGKNAYRQAVIRGADAANTQFEKSAKLQYKAKNQTEYLSHLSEIGQTSDRISERAVSGLKNRAEYIKDNFSDYIDYRKDIKEDREHENKLYKQRISSEYGQTNQTANTLSAIIDQFDAIKEQTKKATESQTNLIKDLQSVVNQSTVKTDPGVFNRRVPVFSGNEADRPAYEQAKAQYDLELDMYKQNKAAYDKYISAKNQIDEAKRKKNEIIASELMKSQAGKTFTANGLDKVLSELKNLPFMADPNDPTKNLVDTYTAQVKELRSRAKDGILTADDSELMTNISKALTNARVYSNALSKQNQASTQGFNGTSGGSGSGDGGKGDKK